jgi:hypothetical protein
VFKKEEEFFWEKKKMRARSGGGSIRTVNDSAKLRCKCGELGLAILRDVPDVHDLGGHLFLFFLFSFFSFSQRACVSFRVWVWLFTMRDAWLVAVVGP